MPTHADWLKRPDLGSGVLGFESLRRYLHEYGYNMKKLHLGLTFLWAIAVVPTLLWWRESILWVAFMSLYANVVGHWSAYQAARAEKVQTSPDD